MNFELNSNDNTVDFFFNGVIFTASSEKFNKEITFVKEVIWNDGLQEIFETKFINIEEENSEFSTQEVIECFEKIPHKELEITIEENED